MEKPVYSSKLTPFITWEEPVLSEIYIKNAQDIVAKINITGNWEMEGEVYDPWVFIPTKFTLTQKDCEEYIVSRIGCDREDTLKRMNIERYDSILMLYHTRGIRPTDKIWFAWDKSDRFEDYHPKATPESWAEHLELLHKRQPVFDDE